MGLTIRDLRVIEPDPTGYFININIYIHHLVILVFAVKIAFGCLSTAYDAPKALRTILQQVAANCHLSKGYNLGLIYLSFYPYFEYKVTLYF